MSNPMFRSVALAAVVAAAATGACGGSDDGTGTAPSRVDSGVDKAKPANTLTQADANKICEALGAYSAAHFDKDAAIEGGCVIFAAFSGGGQTLPTVPECEASVKQCKAQAAMSGGESTSAGSCSFQPSQLSDCTATVQELETCLTQSADASAVMFAKLKCSLFSLPAEEAQKQLSSAPTEACTSLEAKCPSLQFGGSGATP